MRADCVVSTCRAGNARRGRWARAASRSRLRLHRCLHGGEQLQRFLVFRAAVSLRPAVNLARQAVRMIVFQVVEHGGAERIIARQAFLFGAQVDLFGELAIGIGDHRGVGAHAFRQAVFRHRRGAGAVIARPAARRCAPASRAPAPHARCPSRCPARAPSDRRIARGRSPPESAGRSPSPSLPRHR